MITSMRSRENALRLKRFNLDEKRRRVAQIELMVAEFERMAAELDREIVIEQERSGIRDASHFAYSTYARAAGIRRDNLLRSVGELRGQLGEAQAQLDTALGEVRAFEMFGERDRPAPQPQSMTEDFGQLRELRIA
jgi:flagellar protein FliJ